MSYDIELVDSLGAPCKVPLHTEGGTYAVGGTSRAELSVTGNYAKFFYDALDQKQGIRWLYERFAIETIPRLQKAVELLGTEQSSDYWAATPGNAGHALNILLAWARQHPTGIFRGD